MSPICRSGLDRWTLGVRRFTLCTLLLIGGGFSAAHVHATSRIYSTLDQLIARSDVIAVVTIAFPEENTREKPSSGRSFQYTSAAVVRTAVKGEMPEEIVIHHGSGLDDHLFQQGPGEYVVFLKWQKDQFAPTDGWPSSKLVTKGRVTGWSDTHRFDQNQRPLPEVLTTMKAKIGP